MVKQQKRKSKNKPLKRANGQGTVYKLSGRRRKPWVAAVTKGWETTEIELKDVEVVDNFDWGIYCIIENSVLEADKLKVNKKEMKVKKRLRLKLTEINDKIVEGQITDIKDAEGEKHLFGIKINKSEDDISDCILSNVNIIVDKRERVTEILDCFEEKGKAEDALDIYRLVPAEQGSPKLSMTLGQVYEACTKHKLNDPNLSKSTKSGIKASWGKLKKLESRIFSEIRSDEFQDIVDECREGGASKSTLTKLKSLIYSLCEYAYHNGIIKTNYSSLIEIGEVETSEKEPFTESEVGILKEYADKVPWVDTILVLNYTGMRITELVTLDKSNVDMDNKIIIGGIKTDAGKNRVVPIHPVIWPVFVKWYNKDGETIFCNEDGKKLSARAYRENRYRPALEAVGVRPLNPHACRHTFATRMNRVNAPKADIQKIIGHVVGSDTTDKVYTHPEIEDLRKTMEMLK